MRSAMKPEATRLTTPQASFSAARHAVTEIAAIGDDVNLRHRHRHAAADPCNHQQRLQGRRRDRALGLALRQCRTCRPIVVMDDAAAHEERERHDRGEKEYADAGMRCAPAFRGDEVLHHRWPDRAGEIIARRRDRDGNAAPLHKPVRCVGHQRTEACRAADADQQAMRQRDLPDAGGNADQQIAGGQHDRAQRDRHRDTEAVDEFAHEHAAAGKADHAQREGQGGFATADAEVVLNRGQRDHVGPHAGAAEGGQHYGHAQPQPGGRRVGDAGGLDVRVRCHAEVPAVRS